jgi:hypothetical protein
MVTGPVHPTGAVSFAGNSSGTLTPRDLHPDPARR